MLPQRLADLLIEWVKTPDWGASQEHLAAHRDELLTDDAEMALQLLIQGNPGDAKLEHHLNLLRLCRKKGIEAGYEAWLEEQRPSGRALSDEKIGEILGITAAVLRPAAEHRGEWREALQKLAQQAGDHDDADTAGFARALLRLLDEGVGALAAITPEVPAAYRGAWDALADHLRGG